LARTADEKGSFEKEVTKRISELVNDLKSTYQMQFALGTTAEEEIDNAFEAATLPDFCWNDQYNLNFACPAKYSVR